jgi:hypothetical protein
MILARITKALKDQNWLAVSIEFIIVIAGVVIGFQVTGWNADRAERVIIAQQLREVREDVAADIVALDITREASLWRLAAAEYILTGLDDSDRLPGMLLVFDIPVDRELLPEVSPDDHPTLLARVNLVRGITGQRTGYESLINGGNLRLIEDSDLRAAIQRYYAGYADLESNLGIFREIRAHAIPVLYRHGFSLFSEQDLATVLEAGRADPEFVAYLRTGAELAVAQIGITVQRQAEARALLDHINAELAP